MRIEIEGAAARTVDPVKDAGKNRPVLYIFDAHDVHRDGAINIRITGVPPPQWTQPGISLGPQRVVPSVLY